LVFVGGGGSGFGAGVGIIVRPSGIERSIFFFFYNFPPKNLHSIQLPLFIFFLFDFGKISF
jgi:hypothetical protein